METEGEQPPSNEMIVETKELQQIDAMEEALESLVKRIEVFAQKGNLSLLGSASRSFRSRKC